MQTVKNGKSITLSSVPDVLVSGIERKMLGIGMKKNRSKFLKMLIFGLITGTKKAPSMANLRVLPKGKNRIVIHGIPEHAVIKIKQIAYSNGFIDLSSFVVQAIAREVL